MKEKDFIKKICALGCDPKVAKNINNNHKEGKKSGWLDTRAIDADREVLIESGEFIEKLWKLRKNNQGLYLKRIVEFVSYYISSLPDEFKTVIMTDLLITTGFTENSELFEQKTKEEEKDIRAYIR